MQLSADKMLLNFLSGGQGKDGQYTGVWVRPQGTFSI